MSHLTASAPAVALGACIGLGASLYAPRVARCTAREAGPDGARQALPAFGLLAAILSAGFGALDGARFGLSASLPAYLYLAALAPLLGVADATAKRLPNRVLLPAYPIAAALLAFAAWQAGETSALWRAVAAGTVLYALFLAVALAAASGSLGFGDVKLSGLVGGYLGFLGWDTLLHGMTIAFASAAVFVVVRRLVRRGLHDQLLPLGPALLFGTLVAVIAS
jgi:leader peptidase (prepilin peptidase) / N-methyltransferase